MRTLPHDDGIQSLYKTVSGNIHPSFVLGQGHFCRPYHTHMPVYPFFSPSTHVHINDINILEAVLMIQGVTR